MQYYIFRVITIHLYNEKRWIFLSNLLSYLFLKNPQFWVLSFCISMILIDKMFWVSLFESILLFWKFSCHSSMCCLITCFIILVFWPYVGMLSGYSWLYTQKTLLAVLGEWYGILGIKLSLTVIKTHAFLPTVIALQSPTSYF